LCNGDSEFLRELEEIDELHRQGLCPPPFGEVIYTFSGKPPSQQSRRIVRDEFIDIVTAETKQAKYLLSDEVKIEIEWRLHEKLRYETDRAADVDNIIKPVLDALCGPDGILIDDCQVQAVTSYWIDTTSFNQEIKITIKMASPDEYVLKEGLFFVHFGEGLCFPFNKNMPALADLIQHVASRLASRSELERKGADYYQSRRVMPIQIFFHRSRVARFEVVEIEQVDDFLKIA